jgi:hypothetical protein
VSPHDSESSAGVSRIHAPLAILLGLAALLACIYAFLAWLSFRFAPQTPDVERPVLTVLGLLAVAFACYVVAIFAAIRVKQGNLLLAVILLSSLLFRAVSLYSWPILEIDVYRYIWDGAVTLEGVSPYRYSPEQILSATPGGHLPDDLRRLVELRESSESLGTVLSRIHYGELPTIYPPVSQAVFAVAVYLTPANAGVLAHILWMKAAFVVFDLATLAVVIGFLRLVGKHVGWSVAYGWCPLVIKEIANTGHLDSLAAFLSMLALFFAVKSLAGGVRPRRGRANAVLSAILLALAVGAKLYPIVLAPLLAAMWIRGQGWRSATFAAWSFLLVTAVVVWPMLPGSHQNTPTIAPAPFSNEDTIALPPPVETTGAGPENPSRGLTAFLRHWEMNDFLFLIAIENLKPDSQIEPDQQPWFSVVPQAWRESFLSLPSGWLDADSSTAAFFTARLLTATAFLLIAAFTLWRAKGSSDPEVWFRAAFLTLAWFWLLSPTQNPWYWTWALPLVMFTRNRAWLAMSGLTMVYYLRFWLAYHWPDEPVLSTPYAGVVFFDFVVTWLEFGPWFVWLVWEQVATKTWAKHG